jgi:hypothetical protein
MSDVPAAACWLASLRVAPRATRTTAAASGLIASIAVLIRPNLTPLAIIALVIAVFGRNEVSGAAAHSRVHRFIAFAVMAAAALIVLGWIQNVRYGSPMASGYGSVSDAFALGYVRQNLERYPRWLTETHTWFIWLSIGAPVWILRHSRRPLLAWAALAMASAVWALYLPYLYFHPEEWSYTRFLLPAIAIMLIFAAASAMWLLRHVPVVLRGAAIVLLSVLLIAHGVRVARTRGVFDVRNQERKYPLAGAFVRDHLPSNAIVLAAQHSGSIRYYAGRPTFRWDLLSPSRLDQALAVFRRQGYAPFLVVDGGEYDEFKKRFDATHQHASEHPALLGIFGDARVYALE